MSLAGTAPVTQPRGNTISPLQIASFLLQRHWETANTARGDRVIRAPVNTEEKENMSIALLNMLGFSSAAGYTSETLGRTVRLYRDEALLFEAFLKLCKSVSNYHNNAGPRPDVFDVPFASVRNREGRLCIYFNTHNLPDCTLTALKDELNKIGVTATDTSSSFFSRGTNSRVTIVGNDLPKQYWRLYTLLHAAAWRLALHLGSPELTTQNVLTFPEMPGSFGPPEQRLLTMFFKQCGVDNFQFVSWGERLALKVLADSSDQALCMHMNISLALPGSVLCL